jgi:hypothetical protein
MRRLLPFVLITIVGFGALIGGTLLYRAKRVAVLTISKEQIALAKDGGESAHAGHPPAQEARSGARDSRRRYGRSRNWLP